jgi:hypothetical protein
MTVGVTVMSLSDSLLQKISVAMDCVFQIVLNQKILCIVYVKLCETENYCENVKSG